MSGGDDGGVGEIEKRERERAVRNQVEEAEVVA